MQVPAALAAHRQFIVYRAEPIPGRPGKTNKLPIDWRSGQVCNAHAPAVWLSHGEAELYAAGYGPGHGVGWVLTEAAGIWFLDIDECAGPDGWSPLAQQLVAALPGCAVEVSLSGRGLHVFGSGPLPAHGCKNTALHLELYHTERFVALTGTGLRGDAATVPPAAALAWLVNSYFPPSAAAADRAVSDWRDGPVPEWSGPTDDEALVQRMLRAPASAAAAFGGRATLRDLWEGNTEALARAWPSASGDEYDRSSADAALASHLAYWTGNDHERMRRLMQRSALVRDKWQREGYVADTVQRMAARTTRWLQDRPPAAVATGNPVATGGDVAQMPGTEADLAAQFVRAVRGSLAWSPALDWVVRDGPVWRPDDAMVRNRAMRKVCDAAGIGQNASTLKTLGKHATVRAAVNEAASHSEVQIPDAAWDSDPMLLNTPAGVVDLRTGSMRPHGPDDQFLKVTAVAPDMTPAPRWHQFLAETFQGDSALLEFIQRSAGYWLTGDRNGKVFWYLWGHGDTGKSVLMDTLGELLGTYAHVLAPDAIIEHRGQSRHPADIAKLEGKRLATTAELPSGAHLNQALLKNLTGDRTVSARGMGENPRDIVLSHKHVLSSNHKVQLPGGDRALGRRLLLVAFRNRVPLELQNPELLRELRAEGPGILAWAIEGAVKWHRDGAGKLGLRVPRSVTLDSDKYLHEENDVAQWLDECCSVAPGAVMGSAEAYSNYRTWKLTRGSHPESMKAWSPRLEAALEGRAFKVKNSRMEFQGVKLNPPQAPFAPAIAAVPTPPPKQLQ